jgi:hypothetical protein
VAGGRLGSVLSIVDPVPDTHTHFWPLPRQLKLVLTPIISTKCDLQADVSQYEIGNADLGG